MNVRALLNNIKRANRLCARNADRLKYLSWIYDVPRRLGRSPQRPLTIDFQLAEPIGEATISVRCNAGSDAFIFSEVFEHRYYDFDLPMTPKAILDLGANTGLTALFFARKYPTAKLACVEPVPGNLALLRTNMEQNSVAAEIIPKAISTKNEIMTMQRRRTTMVTKSQI